MAMLLVSPTRLPPSPHPHICLPERFKFSVGSVLPPQHGGASNSPITYRPDTSRLIRWSFIYFGFTPTIFYDYVDVPCALVTLAALGVASVVIYRRNR